MVSSGIQRLFYFSWSIIKLNLFFVAGIFCGGIVLGIGPSFQSISDLFYEYRLDYQEITFKRMRQRFKANFKTGNLDFYFFAVILFILSYNLYLAVQIKGLIWLMIDFILIFALLLVMSAYLLLLTFRSRYEVSFKNILKLCFISLFLKLTTFATLAFGILSIGALTYYFKGLLLFASFSFLVVFGQASTLKTQVWLDRKLAEDEKDKSEVF